MPTTSSLRNASRLPHRRRRHPHRRADHLPVRVRREVFRGDHARPGSARPPAPPGGRRRSGAGRSHRGAPECPLETHPWVPPSVRARSCGSGRCPSLADYVAWTGPRSGAIAAGGCWCWLFSGHESSPGTINVDVMTLLGQLLLRKGMSVADEYAIVIRPVHTRLITKAIPALRELRVRVFLVGDESLDEIA